MTAAQITYLNTIADATRMMIDQYHELSPQQAPVRALLTDVAACWMHELENPVQLPTNNFNMLASPATCRVATTQVLRRLAQQTIMREADLADDDHTEAQRARGQTAMTLVEGCFRRLVQNTGFRDERVEANAETREFVRARNILNAELFRERRGVLVPEHMHDSYVAWWQKVDLDQRDGQIQVADTPLLRQNLLAVAMTDTMEWAVTEAFRMAVRGENTAGRLLAALDVPMTVPYLEKHEPAAVPEARSLRELQLTVAVLAHDLQQPNGRLNTMAMDDHLFQLQRLKLEARTMDADAYRKASAPALEYADRVSSIMTRLVHKNDGWVEPPVALHSARVKQRFIVNGNNTLQ
mgnify:CR=1 FL=1